MLETERRYVQIERVLLVAELLAPLRQGASAEELLCDVRKILGEDVCQRTIHRDLRFLQALGVVQRVVGRRRFRWVGGSVRSKVVRELAEACGRRDVA